MAPHQTRLRRLRPVIPFLAAALLALTACGGAPTSGPGSEEGAFPAVATHRYGQTVVQKAPRRVVSLGFTDQDAILALGTVPVAIREFTGNQPSATWPWAADKLQGEQPKVLPAGVVTPEAVAALKPDLIIAITAGLTREEYDAYSRIAPTVAAPDGVPADAVPWQEATRLTGAALGVPRAANDLVRRVEDKFLEAEEGHPELAGATVAAVRPGAGGAASFMAWSSKDLRGQFFKDLGLQMPPDVEERAGKGLYALLPADQLSTLDRADALIVVGSDADRTAFTALPGYGQLNLVRESKVVALDDEQSAALSFSSVLSLPSVVDEVSGRIARAVQR